MSSFARIVETLARHRVEFVIVGGVAAVLHGAPVTTHMLLMTSAGPLDVLGFIGDRSRYEDLEPQIVHVALAQGNVPVLSLEELLRQKRTLGRDKDQPAIRLLEEVLRRRQ